MIDHDALYNKWSESTVSNACVVRVTNQCNQKCRHCAFRSGPDCVGQMSIDMCQKINTWVPARVVINIMGGEFTVLENYPEILIALARGRNRIRLVTNGFWASNDAEKFLQTIRRIKLASCQNLDVAVSTDSWHKTSDGYEILLAKERNLGITVINPGDLSTEDITPIGRAWDNNIAPRGIIQCSCESMSNMMITEDGMLNRCPFGYFPWKHFSETTWADAQEYIWGWRSEKLAEGMSCCYCMEKVKASQCGKPS